MHFVRWCQTIAALPFMEPGCDVWFNDIVGNLPEQEMNEFASYFERTLIATFTAEPIFDRFLWMQYAAVLAVLPRTKNHVKGWHNGFQK